MIKNVDFSRLGSNPNEYDYMRVLKEKIDEIIDHLNLTHGENQSHLDLSLMNLGKYGCGVSMETVVKPERDWIKERIDAGEPFED